MKQRRILPTLTLLTGVAGTVALASLGTGPAFQSALHLWQAMLAPHVARADESDADLADPTVLQNPFAAADSHDQLMASPAIEQHDARMIEQASSPPVGSGDRYAAPPALEPVRPRRVTPVEADEPAVSAVNQPGAAPADTEPPAFADANESDPFAGRVVPVTHEDAVAEAPVTLEPVAEPALAVASSDELIESAPPANSPTQSESEAPPEMAHRSASAGVAVQWMAPSMINVGQEVACQLLVRNGGETTAHDVVVTVELPAGVEAGACEPPANTRGGVTMWRLGDMAPGASLTTHISFLPQKQGDIAPRASVTCTQHVATTIQIVEPRLAMVIEGPTDSVIGQPTPYQFRVTNEGSGPAMNVAVDVALSTGLDAATGSKPRYMIGTLGPGESRHVQVMISGSQQGDFAVHGRAMIGDRAMEKASHRLRVMQPALAVAVDGPKLRFVDRRAAYTITVQNPGPAPIDNVQLSESIPEGFRFVEASSGGSFDRSARQVAWFVGRLEANETATVGVQLLAVEAGDHRLNAAAKADHGVVGEAETLTKVKGAPHVTIDVTEDDDPVEVDGETIYRIRLANQGSTPARRVQFAAEVPREMSIVDINGPNTGTIKGQQLVFPPLDLLEPGQSAAYDVRVKCSSAGQVRFKAYFRSEDTPTAVLEEEITRIYAD